MSTCSILAKASSVLVISWELKTRMRSARSTHILRLGFARGFIYVTGNMRCTIHHVGFQMLEP